LPAKIWLAGSKADLTMGSTDRAALIRIRPLGPWRIGEGVRERTGRIFHSDTLFSAMTIAMEQLGWREEWLDATVRPPMPAVRLGSMFPMVDGIPLAPAPATVWPPPGLSTVRGAGARFLPVELVMRLAEGQPWSPDQWETDGDSECLVRRGRSRGAPFRETLRSRGAMDRLDAGRVEIHSSACIEFGPRASLWCLAQFGEAAAAWPDRVRACFHLLADTGLGGQRSIGWGSFAVESFRTGEINHLLAGPEAPEVMPAEEAEGAPRETGYWLLSMYSPAPEDQIDWNRGSYRFDSRGGRVESRAGWGLEKRPLRMLSEGSFVLAGQPPAGVAHDVAAEGFPHPVYRSGFAVSIPLPYRVNV
jgi:CRISPR type III-A-associated RAMP protein Csm4